MGKGKFVPELLRQVLLSVLQGAMESYRQSSTRNPPQNCMGISPIEQRFDPPHWYLDRLESEKKNVPSDL